MIRLKFASKLFIFSGKEWFFTFIDCVRSQQNYCLLDVASYCLSIQFLGAEDEVSPSVKTPNVLAWLPFHLLKHFIFKIIINYSVYMMWGGDHSSFAEVRGQFVEAGYFFLSYRFQIWNSDHPTPLQKLLLLSHIELLYADPTISLYHYSMP